MTKNSIRWILVAGLVAGVNSLSGCEQAQTVRRVLTPAVIHSAENNSPYSVLEGTTIHIEPHGARFDIPGTWLTPRPAPDEHVKNIFLSWDDLNELNRIDREPRGFDSEDADVINAVLPFEDCVAHVGDRGWGNGLWNDLQSRVYITALTPEEIASRLETDGLKTATTNFEKASLAVSQYKDWERYSFEILDAPTHFILEKRLEFYVRRVNNETVVFVFLHADPFESEIALLLNSFSWSK